MEDEQEPPLQPRTQIQGRVLFLTVCAAGIGGTFQFGYNLSIINAPTLHIQEFTNETWWARTGWPLPDHLVLLVWSLIVSLYPLGGLFGALLAGPFAIKLGSSWVVNKTDSDLIENCKHWKDAGAAHKTKGSAQKPGLEKGRTQGGAEALNSQTLELSSWGR